MKWRVDERGLVRRGRGGWRWPGSCVHSSTTRYQRVQDGPASLVHGSLILNGSSGISQPILMCVASFWNFANIASRRRRLVGIGALIVVLIVVSVWWVAGQSSSGDPGGQVMDQLVPAATALPGYGTSHLPWVSELGLSSVGPEGSYVIKIEPHSDSCDGIAGTQGWSSVVLQAGFHWPGTSATLFSYVNGRLKVLGWNRISLKRNPDEQAMWSLRLKGGKKATASLDPNAYPHLWEFVALSRPVGRAASGC